MQDCDEKNTRMTMILNDEIGANDGITTKQNL
jgi:hypothetical protein